MKKNSHKSCKKKRYCTEDWAERMANITLSKHGIEMRVYKCQYCQGYHLTKRMDWKY